MSVTEGTFWWGVLPQDLPSLCLRAKGAKEQREQMDQASILPKSFHLFSEDKKEA